MRKVEDIKKNMTVDKVAYFLEYYGGEPNLMKEGVLVSRTIDHNPAHQGSRKLYYYDNEEGGLFQSYTAGGQAFDIFELMIKIADIQLNQKINLTKAVYMVCYLLEIPYDAEDEPNNFKSIDVESIKILNRYAELNQMTYSRKKLEFKIYDDKILNNLPNPRILMWENEGISKEVMAAANIRFNPVSQAIVIPYYDKDNKLIGIRERSICDETIEIYGKYRPSYLNGQLYNHPLGLCLYNLNHAKSHIKDYEKVIVVEGEKSVLKYRTFFGDDNDICVATCGSTLSVQQVQSLLDVGAKEIVIAFDRDYVELGDKVCQKQIKNYELIHKKFSSMVNLSFLFDKTNLLLPHMSPLDNGKDTFLQLYKERVII